MTEKASFPGFLIEAAPRQHLSCAIPIFGKSASDVVRAGLRLLEEHEAKVRALQDALIAGEESGPAKPFDPDTFLEEMHKKWPD